MLQTLRKNFEEIDALRDLQRTLNFSPNFKSTPKTPRSKVSWKSDGDRAVLSKMNVSRPANSSVFDASGMKNSRTINLSDSSEMDGAWGGSSRSNKALKRSPGTSGFGSALSGANLSGLQQDDALYTVKTQVNLKMPDGTKKSTITSFSGPSFEEALALLPNDSHQILNVSKK